MPFIKAHNLSLNFPVYSHHSRSFKNSMINKALGGFIEKKNQSHFSISALNNINFELNAGDRLGIQGHNGSGKTTLLRVLAGVYKNYTGQLMVRGSISSLIDISLGMDPEATGYENIRMRGIMMGLSLKQIKNLEDEIADFSELGVYLNLPIRTYSTGMHMRLGFSVSTAIKSEIVIMDEWLSVGDDNFKAKAEKRLKEFLTEKSILILASHSPELINKICNKKLEICHGKI